MNAANRNPGLEKLVISFVSNIRFSLSARLHKTLTINNCNTRILSCPDPTQTLSLPSRVLELKLITEMQDNGGYRLHDARNRDLEHVLQHRVVKHVDCNHRVANVLGGERKCTV